MRSLYSLLVVLSLFVVGCVGGAPDENLQEAPVAAGDSYDSQRLGPPAYALPHELKKSGKADEFDDVRAKNPEWYAITEPTKLDDWSHMNEWQEMQSLVMTISDYVPFNTEYTTMYSEIAKGAATVGDVWVIYKAASTKTKMEAAFSAAGVTAGKVEWINMDNNSIWFIDYGPLPLINNKDKSVAFLDWKYYHQRPVDDAISTRLGQLKGVTTYRMEFGFEGGNFQGDGNGNCFTTQRALQYTGWTPAQVDAGLKKYANCSKTHVIKDISDDGTGHIDMFFKLFAEDKVIVGNYAEGLEATLPASVKAAVENKVVQNRKRMNDNVAQLEAVTVASGGNMKVYRVDMPGYGYDKKAGKWTQTPFTYINSTMMNKVNLWPIFSYTEWEASRQKAFGQWKEALPDWNHVGIISDEVSLASGAIHCITRTVPAGPLKKWIPDGTCNAEKCQPPAGYETLAHVGKCADNAGCFGPKWLCDCNDCTTPGACDPKPTTPTQGCGTITFQGCCNGDSLQFCENDKLTEYACEPGQCGWNAEGNNGEGWYDCKTDGKADPSGKFPHQCDGSGSTDGVDGNSTGTDECAGKVCSADGKCGSCPTGQDCVDGQCKEPTPTCTNTCNAGEAGCLAADTPWSCAFDQGTGCNFQKEQPKCLAGQICSDGMCAGTATPNPGTDGADGADSPVGGVAGADGGANTGGSNKKSGGNASSGCTTSPSQNTPIAGFLLLMGVLSLVTSRRREQV